MANTWQRLNWAEGWLWVAPLCALGALLMYLVSGSKKGPPGPRGLPFLGFYPFQTREPYKRFVQLSREYKSAVIGFYLGNRYSVVLNDFASVREALYQDACLGRPHGTAFELLSDAISLNDISGPYWRENRRTTVRILKELGFDKSPMETQSKYEVEELIDFLKKSEGVALNFHPVLTSSVSNIVTFLVFGERLSYSDPRRRLLDDYILTVSSFFKQTSLHACYPWLKNFLYFFRVLSYDQAKFQLKKFLGYVQCVIEEHGASTEESSSKDYIDGYLKVMSNPASPSAPYLTKSFLKGNIRSLFGAGTEPVRCTLEWSLMTMAHFQDYQGKVHEELDRVLGREVTPSYGDSPRTPLTTAVVYEVMRWLGVVPFSHVRSAMEETKIQGHVISKDAVIFLNLYAVHSDPELWGDPDVFRPERFINQNGKPFRPEFFIPFGLGKRSCPGENMVYIELYIYFASLMHSFRVLPPEGQKVSFDFNLGIAKQPKFPHLRFIPRSS